LMFIPVGEDLPSFRGTGGNTGSSEEAPVSEVAVFAGGCFWCMETAFEGVEGIDSAVSGYTGGHIKNPTYEQVNTHTTGHLEAVRVTFDPDVISYDRILDIFWVNVDPTDGKGQFCDRGNTYASAVFVSDWRQRVLARASLARARSWLRVDEPIVTPIRDTAPFYEAEDYHQDYYRKNPEDYRSYRKGCGRDERLEELWKDTGNAPDTGHRD